MHTPTSIDGVEIFSEGEGKDDRDRAIVMVHGWPDTWRLWDLQVAALRAHWRCVRFTLPGFDNAGPVRCLDIEAMARVLHAIVLHAGGGKPVVLMLHDWGCIYGLQFAMRHPELVSRIVAVDVGDAGGRAFLRSLSFKAKLMAAGYQLWLAAAWRVRGSAGTRMTRAMARWLGCRSDPAAMSWQMNYPYWLTWTRRMGRARRVKPACPVLFVYGERKPFMFHSPGWLARIQALPGSMVVAMPTGHWVMRQAPDAFNAAVIGWLSKEA